MMFGPVVELHDNGRPASVRPSTKACFAPACCADRSLFSVGKDARATIKFCVLMGLSNITNDDKVGIPARKLCAKGARVRCTEYPTWIYVCVCVPQIVSRLV